jgi:hypothetical protein
MMAAPNRALKTKSTSRAPRDFDVGLSLFGTRLALEGVAEGLRKFCQRGKDEPITHADHCLLSVLYERLDDEAATLVELEKSVSKKNPERGGRI